MSVCECVCVCVRVLYDFYLSEICTFSDAKTKELLVSPLLT